MGPPHDFFCDCCEWWRKQEELLQKEAKSAEKREGEQEEVADKDFHSSQADGFTD